MKMEKDNGHPKRRSYQQGSLLAHWVTCRGNPLREIPPEPIISKICLRNP